MSQQRCQRATSCAGLGAPVGYIPMTTAHTSSEVRRVEVCHTCFADAERVGFFCVRYGENEAHASKRHDKVVGRLHDRALSRRVRITVTVTVDSAGFETGAAAVASAFERLDTYGRLDAAAEVSR